MVRYTVRSGPQLGVVFELPASAASHVVRQPVTAACQYHGMTEVLSYHLEYDACNGSSAVLRDHSLDGDPSCTICGRCRVLDEYGRCPECRRGYLQRHEDDPSIVRKDR